MKLYYLLSKAASTLLLISHYWGQEKLFDTLVETVETELDKQSSKAEHLILNAQ